jgi:hypothetical protein
MIKSWLLCAIILSLIFSGCTEKKPDTILPDQTREKVSTGKTIQFETLDSGESMIANLEKPALFVASNVTETTRFTGLLDSNVANRIEEVDFSKAAVIAIFRGLEGSSGYGIAVQEVRLNRGVEIIVELSEPHAEQAVRPVDSFPYQIILIQKDKLPVDSGTGWTVYTQDGIMLTRVQ